MSVKVTVDDLADRLDEYGTAAFVITVGVDSSPKVVHVPVVWDGEVLRCTPGGGTLANLTGSGPVTLVFPAVENGGYSMFLDGRGVPDADDDAVAVIEFTGGVLHRPAPDAPGGDARC
ncbi:MAG: pyridoxamine 5'-phosphate oxidase family protein [Actinomycetota bacterium]|nr:pyridoxamine 5'-phosphate oxidase family protein [Actinomycetota bacterium]